VGVLLARIADHAYLRRCIVLLLDSRLGSRRCYKTDESFFVKKILPVKQNRTVEPWNRGILLGDGGWATSSESPERLRCTVVTSSAGRNSSCEQHSQSTEERAILDRYHHFHGHPGRCA
jgi:hypothetical protein